MTETRVEQNSTTSTGPAVSELSLSVSAPSSSKQWAALLSTDSRLSEGRAYGAALSCGTLAWSAST
eukprot:scaffold88358_cov71-Phaeocystis_antarctica.AAC.9